MRTLFALVLFGFLASAQVCSAQLNIESDGNTVTIGPGGISIQSAGAGAGTSISTTSSKRYVKTKTGTSNSVTSKVRASNSGASNSGSSNSGASKAGASLEEQVAALEIQIYGKKSSAPLLARIEKLEMDNTGKKGIGPLKQRIAVLIKAVGGVEPGPVSASSASSVQITGSPNDSTSPSASISITPGNGLSITTNSSGSNTVLRESHAPGSNLVFNATESGSIKCSDNNAVINSSRCNLNFQGSLHQLTINGSNNQITCDVVSKITVSGSNNSVTWNRSSGQPAISNWGSNNALRDR